MVYEHIKHYDFVEWLEEPLPAFSCWSSAVRAYTHRWTHLTVLTPCVCIHTAYVTTHTHTHTHMQIHIRTDAYPYRCLLWRTCRKTMFCWAVEVIMIAYCFTMAQLFFFRKDLTGFWGTNMLYKERNTHHVWGTKSVKILSARVAFSSGIQTHRTEPAVACCTWYLSCLFVFVCVWKYGASRSFCCSMPRLTALTSLAWAQLTSTAWACDYLCPDAPVHHRNQLMPFVYIGCYESCLAHPC